MKTPFQSLYSSFFAKFLILLVASSLLTIGCTRNSDVKPIANASTNVDGKSLFLGLVLKLGPVAQQIPITRDFETTTVSSLTISEQAALLKFSSDVITKIDQMNPGYFSSFKKEIQSGNQLLVNNALLDAKTKLSAAIVAMPNYAEKLNSSRKIASQIDTKSVSNSDGTLNMSKLRLAVNNLKGLNASSITASPDENTCVVLVLAVVVYVALAVDAAVASNVAAAVAGYLYLALYGPALTSPKKSSVTSSTTDSLANNMFINQVTERFSSN